MPLKLATGASGPVLPDGVTAGSAVPPAADARDPLAAPEHAPGNITQRPDDASEPGPMRRGILFQPPAEMW